MLQGKRTADRRILKTRKLLHEALLSLILEKDYESIIVQEILDRANVGRSTFYMHFRDKDELLISGIHDLRGMLHAAQAAADTDPEKSYEKIIGFSQQMFEHAYDYRNVWKALIGSQAGSIIRQHLQDILADLISSESRREFQKRKRADSRVPFELFVHFLASTFISVMTWWIGNKNPMTPKTINDIFRALVIPSIAANFD